MRQPDIANQCENHGKDSLEDEQNLPRFPTRFVWIVWECGENKVRENSAEGARDCVLAVEEAETFCELISCVE